MVSHSRPANQATTPPEWSSTGSSTGIRAHRAMRRRRRRHLLRPLRHEYGLTVSVRGGGHSIAGKAICDDGLMIDLSAMKGIRVDPASRTVRAEPGLTIASSIVKPRPSVSPPRWA